MKNIQINNIPLIRVILSAAIIFVVQWMWWGSLFKNTWQPLNGLTEADLVIPQGWWIIAYIAISMQVFGINLLLKKYNSPNTIKAIKIVFMYGLLFLLPIAVYKLTYLPNHSWQLFFIDSGSYLIGWIIGSIGLSIFRKHKPLTK